MFDKIDTAFVYMVGVIAIMTTSSVIKNFICELIKKKINGKNSIHCKDHYKLTNDITEVKTDVKWIRKSLDKGK